jgi:hypothetical protein
MPRWSNSAWLTAGVTSCRPESAFTAASDPRKRAAKITELSMTTLSADLCTGTLLLSEGRLRLILRQRTGAREQVTGEVDRTEKRLQADTPVFDPDQEFLATLDV